MTMFETLWNTLPTTLQETYQFEAKKTAAIPRLPSAQCIVIPLVRTSIAPMIIRNNDAELTTEIYAAGANRVRMIASKTKGVERRHGSQILRWLDIGVRVPTNKAFRFSEKPMSTIFDLNTLVFGDSAKGDKAIYPVHAAVLYSDALSVEPIKGRVDSVFRLGGISDDGTTFDVINQNTSKNIFTTYSVKSGTRFVQTLVLIGNRMTREALDHLLLSIGLAGSYGGSTATTGTNLETTVAGIYWGTLERAINAPGHILSHLDAEMSTEEILTTTDALFQKQYPHALDSGTVTAYLQDLVDQLENEDTELRQRYRLGNQKAGELFDAWFPIKIPKSRGGNHQPSPSASEDDLAEPQQLGLELLNNDSADTDVSAEDA